MTGFLCGGQRIGLLFCFRGNFFLQICCAAWEAPGKTPDLFF